MMIYSKSVVLEALKNNRHFHQIYLSSNFDDKNILDLIKIKKIKVEKVDKSILFNKCGSTLHQGIVALVDDYTYLDLDLLLTKKNLRIVILDELSDPHNLGSIIRSADAFSFDAIIIPSSNSISLNSTVARVSTGSIEYVNIVKVSSIYKAILKLKEHGITIIGTDLKTTTTYQDLDYKESIAIVFGSEGFGIRPLVLKACDKLITIPMNGKINSLNVGVSAGIIMSYIANKE